MIFRNEQGKKSGALSDPASEGKRHYYFKGPNRTERLLDFQAGTKAGAGRTGRRAAMIPLESVLAAGVRASALREDVR